MPTPVDFSTLTPTSKPLQLPSSYAVFTPSGSSTPSLEPIETPATTLPSVIFYAIAIVAVGIAVIAVILFLKKQKK
jgi:hypothetical protein